ncbi:uncharacterized protein EAE98_008547 [Botrytis deweyae]|uniref:Protein kinase domain-containing protein n=1 Tax=Botrytis deweyae TaxID=2478750 RepID=A0ABQ7IEI4_9HELO|nr:uncharacterized protein EAE98_008547 [Botrytis deweyae]KAF7921700.1 hypothetical protein EAE98_008547 [Botrytis deweyae]
MDNQNTSRDTSSTEVIVYKPMQWRNLAYTPATSAPSLTANTGAKQLSLNVGSFDSASKPQPLKGTIRRCPQRQAELHRGSHLTTFKQGRLVEESFCEKYRPLKVIGKGGFGLVYSIEEKATNKLFAVKMVLKHTENAPLQREWNLHKKLNHPSILRVHDFYACIGDGPGMVMDLGEKTMSDMIHEQGYIEETRMKMYFMDILLGLEYLKSKNILHRDIKPGNMILGRGSGGRMMIADFGLVDHLVVGERIRKTSRKGTMTYMAPECFRKSLHIDGLGFEVDIWAAGVSLFQCLLGYHPFDSAGPANDEKQRRRNTILMIINPKAALDFESGPLRQPISQEVADLLGGMLEIDFEKRLTVEDCLEHEWMSG